MRGELTHAKGAKVAMVLATAALAALLEPPYVGCYKLRGAASLGRLAGQQDQGDRTESDRIKVNQGRRIFDRRMTIYGPGGCVPHGPLGTPKGRAAYAKIGVGFDASVAGGCAAASLRHSRRPREKINERPMNTQKLNQIRLDRAGHCVTGDGWRVAGFEAQGAGRKGRIIDKIDRIQIAVEKWINRRERRLRTKHSTLNIQHSTLKG